MNEPTQSLEKELKTFRDALPELAADEGKYALVHGEDVVGVFETYADALKIGYEKFGMEPFLVKKILADEQVAHFTRDIGAPCPH